MARRLRERAVADVDVPAAMPERILGAVDRRRARRRLRAAVGAAGVAAAAVFALLNAPLSDLPGPLPAEVPPLVVGPAVVETLAEQPIEPRGDFVPVWTGTSVLVWGGSDRVVKGADVERPDTRYYADGARYSPSANAWTPMSPAPLAGRSNYRAVWTGTEMIVVGGATQTARTSADVAAYDPRADRWRTLPRLPVAPDAGSPPTFEAVWAGDRLVVWLRPSDRVFAYEAGQWRELPGTGLSGEPVGQLLWDGTQVVALASGSGGSLSGAALDATGRWQALDSLDFAVADLASDPNAEASAVGDRGLVVWSATERGPAYLLPRGSRRWQEIGPTPLHGLCEGDGAAVPLGSGFAVLARCAQPGDPDVFFFDPAGERWSGLDLDGGPDTLGVPVVGTDRSLILLGTKPLRAAVSLGGFTAPAR